MLHLMEPLYRRMPHNIQNAAISTYGRIWRRRRLGGDFAKYVAEFQERERWPKWRMDQHLASLLARTVVRAFERVPYYRERWSAAGFRPGRPGQMKLEDLREIPVTPKDDFRAAPDAFVVERVDRAARVHSYPSSGSTGTPVLNKYTSDGHRRFIAAREARSFQWAGVSIRMPRSTLGGRMIVSPAKATPPFYRYNAAERQVYLSAFHIRPANMGSYLEGLNRYQPVVLTGYALPHFFLARLMLEHRLKLDYRPKALILGSEKLSGEMRACVEKAFQAPVFEEYGASENCCLATECEHGRLHVSPDFGLIEILDDQGRPGPAGELGNVVCTGFMNELQPLIRYEIGDRASWSSEDCPCGRSQLPVLRELVGRCEDVARGPDGRSVTMLHSLFVDLAVREAQVVQERLDLFRIRVAPTPEFSGRQQQIIRQRLRDRLGEVTVEFEIVDAIPRTERGKLRVLVSKLPKEELRPMPQPARIAARSAQA